MSSQPRVSAIYRYPMKSARGHSLDAAEVEPWGLAGDRRWMVTDELGRFLTGRELPKLLLIEVEESADALSLRLPGGEPMSVTKTDADRSRVQVFRSEFEATHLADVDDALSDYLGRSVQLMWLDDPTRRTINPEFSHPDDRVSLADGYPLLLTTTASLAALNDEVLAAADHPREPIDMRRFRPNLVIDGTDAWAEDAWARVRVGEAQFRVAKGCPRCVLSTKDPDTGEGGKEPIASLSRIRKRDGEVWFGVNLICDNPGVSISVGDAVEVFTR